MVRWFILMLTVVATSFFGFKYYERAKAEFVRRKKLSSKTSYPSYSLASLVRFRTFQ